MSMIVNLICSLCGEQFQQNLTTLGSLGLSSFPKSCPRCNDVRQVRPVETMPVSRELLAEFPCLRIDDSICKLRGWEAFRPQEQDRAGLRLRMRGAQGNWAGARWEGRQYVYVLGVTLAEGAPLESAIPEYARFRAMRATHEKGWTVDVGRGRRMEGTFRREPETFSPVHEYVALEPHVGIGDSATTLRYVSASSKTTLKGYGRQFERSLDLSRVLWRGELLSAAAVTGRFSCHGALAVTDQEHPAIVTGSDIDETR